jgi:RimJ/RimL family protein N-acetyltransferase
MDTPLAPVLETERLTLRAHALGDYEDCLALWSHPDVIRHIGGRAFTSEEVWTRLLRYVGHWPLLGYGFWRVGEKGSDRFVGEVGFADGRRGLGPEFDGFPEAGWVLAPWAQGRGYALEATRAALAWGDARFGGRTVCMIHPENAPSIRLAETCGYREFARTAYHERPTVLFERLSPSRTRR